MYDLREKAIRDRKNELDSARLEGKKEGERQGEARGEFRGEIRLIHTLQELLGLDKLPESDSNSKSLEELRAISAQLQKMLQNRG